MNAKMKRTMLALAIAAMFGTSMAYAADDEDTSANIDHQHVVNDARTHSNTVVNDTTNNTTNNSSDTKLSLDAAAKLRLDAAAKLRYDSAQTDRLNNTENNTLTNTETNTLSNSETYENVEKNETVNVDVRKDSNSHSVDVKLKKSLSLTSDIDITGSPTVSGDIQVDSAAIAVIDNRQSVSGNVGENDGLDNTSSIKNHVGSDASGNIGMNVAAGDNNAQDNAAALSAADASFSFGMADAEVFVNQNGSGNGTMNAGVTNAAGVGNNAFNGATGNIGVNVTSGNNNEQKNALAASVATTDYAQSSISSNQISSGNEVSNQGTSQEVGGSSDVTLTGYITGSGSYAGGSTGGAYQQTNFYPDNWDGDVHPGGGQVGHSDWDNETEGAVLNPHRTGQTDPKTGQAIGGMAWDTDSKDSGKLTFGGIDDAGLAVSLSGSVNNAQWVVTNASNDASLSGHAFANASGNIGVNVSSGSGNLQANSLALAVAQPSSSTPPPPPPAGGE